MTKIYSFNEVTDSVELLEKKPPRFIAVLLCFLFLFLICFIIWAIYGNFEVVSKGTAMVESKSDVSVSRAQVQGIVDTVHVSSGDEVKKGDILLYLKNQELGDGKKETIKAKKDGVVQFPSIIQQGNLIDSGQEIVSIIPKEKEKKVKILLSPQERNGINKGDKAQYSFKLKNTDKQTGTVTYIAAHPIFDKNSKEYMYELEATISTQDLDELYIGMAGKVSIVTGEVPIWKNLLKKLDIL
ncbi:HlyD family efflux transporter periplasmic adaptor subunit [Virgibacillus chiguensis]|uniref:Biotin-lipoyl like n=1 Tax=Virgibacillus chiguensis TaxID=411959 RepID=A0A1M5XI54_9BACI|nr:HlyD family secretion protein [Virgibacillus chiguensis]SHH99228.1 Biotin-lipoyl like [Virgibacillus chiguensis]